MEPSQGKKIAPSNTTHASQSFQFDDNISQSQSANCLSQHITQVDLKCSLFMDESSEDLDNYLKTPLPEYSKSLSVNDFECKTMNNLSKNIKRKYQKKLRLSKKNNKFFKSKSNENLTNPNEIPVINEAMRKIFGPILDKPAIKGSPKVSLKTYSNKHKPGREIKITESFGLPDQPLVAVLNECVKEQDNISLDVDEGNFNNIPSDSFSIYSEVDQTMIKADELRRRSFSLFEDIVPSVGDSLENEVKEGFNFEETTEVGIPITSESNILLQSLSDQNIHEPKIFLQPLNLDDHQIFKVNNLSPITNKKKLLFERLQNYSKSIEYSKVKMSKSTIEVPKKNDNEYTQSKDNAFLEDNMKFINNSRNPTKDQKSLSSKYSRKSARLINGCNEKCYPDHLSFVKDNCYIEANRKDTKGELIAGSLKDKIKLRDNQLSIQFHEANHSVCYSGYTNKNNANNKMHNVGIDEKIIDNKKNSCNKYNPSVNCIFHSSPKRITRQSAQNLVFDKFLNTVHDDQNKKPSRSVYEKKLKHSDEIRHKCETKELKNGKFDIIFQKSIQNNLKNEKFKENSFEEDKTLIKRKGTNILIIDERETNWENNIHLGDKEKHISTSKLNNEKVCNDTLVQSSQILKTTLRRSRRGKQKILEEKDCKEVIDDILPDSVTDSKYGKDNFSDSKCEENVKFVTNSIDNSFKNRFYDDFELKGRQSRIERISDRLRSKSVHRLRSFEKLSSKGLSIKDVDDNRPVHFLTEPDFLHTKKKSKLNNSMKRDKISCIRNSTNGMDMVDQMELKPEMLLQKEKKKVAELFEESEISSSEHNLKVPNDMESPQFDKNGELNNGHLKAENFFFKSEKQTNENYSIQANVESLVPTLHQKKELDLETSEKIVDKIKLPSTNLGITLDTVISPIKNKQKKLNESCPLSDDKSSNVILSHFTSSQKTKNGAILKSIKKTLRRGKLLDKDSPELEFDMKEIYKRSTRSNSPKKCQQKNQLSEISEICFVKSRQKVKNNFKSVIGEGIKSKKGSQFDESIEGKCIESNKYAISKSPRKCHLSRSNKFSFKSGKCSKSKLFCQTKRKNQDLSYSLGFNKITQNKSNRYYNSSEVERSERDLGEKLTLDHSKLPIPTKKIDKLGEKQEVLNENGFNRHVPITPFCLVAFTDSKSNQKQDNDFIQPLSQLNGTLFSCKSIEVQPSPVNASQKERETIVESGEIGLYLNDVPTKQDSLKYLSTKEIIIENVRHSIENEGISNTLNEQFCNELQLNKMDKPDSFSKVTSLKSTISVTGSQITDSEKVEQVLSFNELSVQKFTENCVKFENNLGTKLHVVNLTPKKIHQIQKESNEHLINKIEESEGISNVSSQTSNWVITDRTKANDSVKTRASVRGSELTAYEKVDLGSHNNEQLIQKSTKDCLILEDMPSIQEHLIHLRPQKHQIENKCNAHSLNEVDKSETGSNHVGSGMLDKDIPGSENSLKIRASTETSNEKVQHVLNYTDQLIKKSTDDYFQDMLTSQDQLESNISIKHQNHNEFNFHMENAPEKSKAVSDSRTFNENINSSNNKQKIEYHCQNIIPSENEKDLAIKYAEKLTSKDESIKFSNNFKIKDSQTHDIDSKIGDTVNKDHLSALYLKKDIIPNNKLDLPVSKMDFVLDTKSEKKTDGMKNSPTIFDKKGEIYYYSTGKKLRDDIELQEYLDIGYDMHRRTSFRKILERVMALSRLEVEVNQKKDCRLQRCKSVPHEKFNCATKTYPVSLSVNNTLQYLKDEKSSEVKKNGFSNVEKCLDYFADANRFIDLKKTRRRTKSLHISQTYEERELKSLEGREPFRFEIEKNYNKVASDTQLMEETIISKKRKGTEVLESDQYSNGVELENIDHDKIHRDDTYLKLCEPNMSALEGLATEIDSTYLQEPSPKKRSISLLEKVNNVDGKNSLSIEKCNPVIRRSKKNSKRGKKRRSRISQLGGNVNKEYRNANSLCSSLNSTAVKKVLYEFKVGDSVWGKVGNYPYWPCVIVFDPESSEFKKYKVARTTPYYHVRFFGDKGKRAWTSHVIPYEGSDDLERLEKISQQEGVQTSYIKECYRVKASQYEKWKKAVFEAETMKNESSECKINFFRDIFGEENRLPVDEGSSKIETNDSINILKNIKNNQNGKESGPKLPKFQREKVPMKISSVISCISDVISKYGSSGDDCYSDQGSHFASKDFTSRGKRKKKKIVANTMQEDTQNDLGIELLNLPPTVANSLIISSESNVLGSSKDALDELSPRKISHCVTISPKRHSRSAKNKVRNENILKDTNEIPVLNNFMSNRDSSIDALNSSASIRTRSRSLPRIDVNRVKGNSISKSEFCKTPYELTSHSIPVDVTTLKLKDKKQNVPVDQSDSESRASENSFLNNSTYKLSHYKKNLFRGVTKEKVCQICEKSLDVIKCRGQCNGDYHVKCVENSLIVTNEKVADLFKRESIIGDHDQDERNEQVQIITVGSRKKLLDNLILSPHNKETSLTETQIDRKMKEIMSQVESNESYNSEFLESTDSGGDEIDYNLKQDSKSHVLNKNSYRRSESSQKSKGLVKHVTADDVRIITQDVTVKRKAVHDGTNSYLKETFSIEDCVYRCPYCTSSVVPSCFVCNLIVSKKGNTTRQRCSLQKCGRFFHLECLNIWPQTQWSFVLHEKRKSEAIDNFVCPRHVCHTCASENLGYCIGRCPSDKLVKCLRCPATYHNSYHCVPAGSQILSTTQIICPRHIQEQSKRPVTCNTIWCFVCSEGGNLICCETCPTSVHAECLPVNLMDDDSYICEDCESGRFPLYDEVVWVKCGTFRWWPAIILLPSEVPANVEAKPHNEGDFVVKFFGTYDYFWVGRGRTFLYQEGDTGYLNSNKNRIDEAFSRALKEAADVYSLKKESKSKRDIEVNNGLKPPSYVRIKVNRPVGNVRVFEGNLSNTTSCDCDPKDPNPCGPNSNCLNRILLTECNPEVCSSGQKCNNQSFEKREYPKLIPCRTEGRGWGLKTMEFIQKGQFIIEYVGEIIDDEEYQRRITRMHQQKDENYYFLTIDNNRMLDAGPKGNAARFMNHSCQPNCETQKWTVNGDTRVGLFAIEEIPAGTELTFNYNLQCAGTDKKICRCGASNCSGYIGVKPDDRKQARKVLTEKKKQGDTRTEGKNKSKCVVCGNNGDVRICSNRSCSKSYHLKCVQLDFWPDKKWTCPSHSCNICSKRTTRSCVQCTNSFCLLHSNDNIRYDSQLGFVCSEHDNAIKKGAVSKNNTFSDSDMIDRDFSCQNVFEVPDSSNVISDKSKRLRSQSKRYRNGRNYHNEESQFVKKIKLANGV